MDSRLDIIIQNMVKIIFIQSAIVTAAGESAGNSITISSDKKDYKPGDLVWSDEFDDFSLETWNHELTFEGPTTHEFQMNINSRVASYADNGYLYIKPRLATEIYNEDWLLRGEISLEGTVPIDSCTNPRNLGCKRKGNYPHSMINPTLSARIRTVYSFYFQYGRVDVRARIPSGDWTWPVITLLPRFNKYGSWPASGEIRLLESRGNRRLRDSQGNDIGSNVVSSGLHFGPYFPFNGYEQALVRQHRVEGYHTEFHLYSVEWTEDRITFMIDNITTKVIAPPSGGFWELGEFDKSEQNPWKGADNKIIAPFDQKYFISLSVGVGGTDGHFPDDSINGKSRKKPWVDTNSTGCFLTFYEARKYWLPTWSEDNAALVVDYIRVFAI